MSSPEVDRNLLLGVLALQMEFIDKDALVAAMHAWVLEKSKSLGKILCEQGRLTEGDYHALVALVERHVERHRGDARQGLVSLRLIGAVPREIDQFPDEVIQATLAPMRASAPMHPSKITTLPPAPRPGSSNERFEILRPHAWGGLGEVCLARDKELNREVALKRILERHAGDADSCARFLQEAEITGSLEHPGIVPVYALGTDGDGRPFYAMRFIRGETLKDAIERFHSDTTKSESDRRIELRQLLQRFLAVCNALEYAHSRGVIHRDLKPSNIMLDKYGETLVVDWGLAKALGQRSEGAAAAEVTLIPSSGSGVSATQAGSAIGTPVFMSPEQAAGRLDAIGPQSDVYSLGATLYVLLAGKEPFDGMVGIVLAKVQDGLFIPPKAIKPTVPSALNAICLKAMSRNPQDRHASCADLGRDVERWLADEPVSAFRDPFSVRVVRWIRRHRALTAGSAALATALLLALSVGTIVLGRANTQIRHANDEIKAKSDEKERQRTEAERQRDEAERLRKLTMRQLYVAQMNAAARAWDEHSAGRTLELLEAERPELTDGVDLRGWEWHRLWRLSHSELHMLDSPMVSLAVTGDGQQILGSDWNGRLQIRSAIDLHEIRTIEAHERRFDRIQLSADGKLVATSGDDSKVKLWDFATWKVLRELPGTHFVRYGMSLSRDGSRIAIASDDVHLYSTNDGKELARLSTGMQQVTALAFAPDGKSVFSASSENGNVVTMWDVATAKSVRTYTGHRATIRTLAISPDGHVVVSGSNDGEIRAWDVKAGKPLVAFRPHEAIVTSLTFREDGRRLVSTSNDTTIKIWDVETWHEVQTLRGHFQSVIDAIYTQSGNALVSTSFDETVRNWDAASRQEPWTDRSAGSPIFTVVYSSDGRYLAAGSSCFTAVWDAASGLKLWEERDPVERIPEWDADERFSSRVLCFDPQSQLLARGLTNGNVRILEAKTGKLRSAWRAANGPIWSVAFTANGRKLGTTGGETPQLSLWNPNDGAPVNFRAKLPRIVVGILSIPSHDQIATWGIAENANVSLFDISTGRMVQKFEAAIHLPYCAAASPDGRQIVIGGRAQSLEWLDIETGQRRQILRPHAGSILGLAFSPDCRRLASSSADCSVKIWDAESRQEVLTIKPDDTRATCIVFSPDGTRLAACTESGTVWVWDARPLTPKLRADILAADVTNRDLKSKPQPAN